MPQSDSLNRRYVLARRPEGLPDADTLRLETAPVPQPGPAEMLLRTVFLSLDPYMRGRMSDAPSYAPPVALGEVMVGGTVAQVVRSNIPAFAPGDLVLCGNGWQDYALSDGTGVVALGPNPEHPSWALGILGMPGFTAWAGLTQIGTPKPGETLVVAAATGAVGATVGQIGKILGCRVVGIAGGPEKCRWALESLGYDACIDHHAEDFAAALKAAVPSGIDIYFENVGGKVLDAVLPLLNTSARIPVCGLIAQYNLTAPQNGPDRLPMLMSLVLRRRMRLQGFIIFQDYPHLYGEFTTAMTGWLAEGRITYREDMVEGLEAAPEAFVGLLAGKNFGKRVLRVGPLR